MRNETDPADCLSNQGRQDDRQGKRTGKQDYR
jgi:hypothetical protein